MDGSANILETGVFSRLHNTYEFASGSIVGIVEAVNNYLDRVVEAIELQCDVIYEKLEEARSELAEAEAALASCEASQNWDEEEGRYTPSCRYEAANVASARKEVDDWQCRYEQAKRILSECKAEQEKYHFKGGFIQPPGGEWTMRQLVEYDTKDALEALDGVIRDAEDIMVTPLSPDKGSVSLSESPAHNVPVSERDRPLTEKERTERARNIVGFVMEDIENHHEGKTPRSNRVIRCPECGCSLTICTCQKRLQRERVAYKVKGN